MIDINVEVKGLDELEKKLVGLGLAVAQKQLKGALMRAAKPFADEIKQTAPESDYARLVKSKKTGEQVEIRPGFYKSRVRRRSKIRKKTRQRGFSGSEAVRVRVGVFRVRYAGHLEFGTANMPAHPVIRPAFERRRFDALAEFKKDLEKRIERVRNS